jgi:hypothetical protein
VSALELPEQPVIQQKASIFLLIESITENIQPDGLVNIKLENNLKPLILLIKLFIFLNPLVYTTKSSDTINTPSTKQSRTTNKQASFFSNQYGRLGRNTNTRVIV